MLQWTPLLLVVSMFECENMYSVARLTGTKLPDVRECSLCLSRFISVLACSYLCYTMAGRATTGNMIADISDRILSLA